MNQPSKPPSIRLVLPAYRDREAVENALRHLLQDGWHPQHIRVVTAGEPDTRAAVEALGVPALDLPPGQRGRARQMNAGARDAGGDLLLFLHADTRLPPDARAQLVKAWCRGAVGGGFRRRFDSPSLFLRITCALADLRGKTLGWFFGDQTIWARREAFERLGGFPDRPRFEDLDFSRRLNTLGPTALLPGPTLSSARRFETDGPALRTWKDLKLTRRYLREPPLRASSPPPDTEHH